MGQVTAPTLFLLGELDTGASPDGWPAAMAKDMTTTALTATTILPQGVHLFFQQPSALDEANPPTTATRIEQLRAAMAETRSFLDSELGVRAATALRRRRQSSSSICPSIHSARWAIQSFSSWTSPA